MTEIIGFFAAIVFMAALLWWGGFVTIIGLLAIAVFVGMLLLMLWADLPRRK